MTAAAFAQPVLLPAAGPVEPVPYPSAVDLARRIHDLRARRRLECSPGRASLGGGPDFPCVTLRAVTGDDGARVLLGTVAGPGVDTVEALMTALRAAYPTPNGTN